MTVTIADTAVYASAAAVAARLFGSAHFTRSLGQRRRGHPRRRRRAAVAAVGRNTGSRARLPACRCALGAFLADSVLGSLGRWVERVNRTRGARGGGCGSSSSPASSRAARTSGTTTSTGLARASSAGSAHVSFLLRVGDANDSTRRKEHDKNDHHHQEEKGRLGGVRRSFRVGTKERATAVAFGGGGVINDDTCPRGPRARPGGSRVQHGLNGCTFLGLAWDFKTHNNVGTVNKREIGALRSCAPDAKKVSVLGERARGWERGE